MNDQADSPTGPPAAGGDASLAPCQLCGFGNLPTARFCSGCGSHLATHDDATQVLQPIDDDIAAPPGSTPPVEPADGAAPPRVGAELVVTSGHREGMRWPVGGWRVTVGRHPDSQVFLDDITVSRRHVELRATPGGAYELHDVGSLNGTYLNDVRIGEPQLLGHGDLLRVGKFLLQYLDPNGNG